MKSRNYQIFLMNGMGDRLGNEGKLIEPGERQSAGIADRKFPRLPHDLLRQDGSFDSGSADIT